MFDFEPQSWEMPFDGAMLEDPADKAWLCLDGVKVECQMRVIPPRPQLNGGGWKGEKIPLFFFSHRWPDAGFVQCSEDFTYPVRTRYGHILEPLSLIDEFVDAWEKDKVARLFWINESGALRQAGEVACESLLVTASGTATWSYYSSGSSAFSWSVPLTSNEFAGFSALEIWERIQRLLEEQDGETDFARQFARFDSDAKRALIFKNLKHGDETDFKSVLEDILISHDVWDEARQSNELKLTLLSSDEVELTFENLYAVYGVDTPPSLLGAVERACQWFEPFDTKIVNRRCMRDWMRTDQGRFEVTAQRPNAHEKLEAHLRWQEWLAKTQEVGE
jgi:hypothetical protein